MFRNPLLLVFTLVLMSNHSHSIAQQTPTAEVVNWPAFRGNGQSVATASNLPDQWNDDLNIAWNVELPGYGQSSPVTWQDRVFVTTMQGEMKDVPTLLCVGLTEGKTLWKQEFKGTQQIKASDYVTRSAPTPAVDADRCYAFFESGEFLATDHDGKVLWKRSLVDEYGQFLGNHGIGSSIVIDDQSVFVLVAHEGPSYLLAVDKATGENRWKTDLEPKVSWTSPTLANGQIILSVSGTVEGYDTATGTRAWSVSDVTGNTVASVTVHDDLAFVGSSERQQNLALRIDADGKTDQSQIVWRTEDATCSFSSPLYHDGHVYYVNKQGAGVGVDAATGKTTWKERLSGSCWASPIAADGKLYFFTKDGTTDVYSAGPEPKLLHKNPLTVADRIYGVAVADSRLVIRTGTRLICIANPTSEKVTTTAMPAEAQDEAPELKLQDFPEAITSFGAAVSDGYLYVLGGNKGTSHTYSASGQNNQFRRIALKPGSQWESLGEVPRRQGNALVAHGGKLYRLGGFEARNANAEDSEDIVSTNDFAVYDPQQRTWTDLIPLPEPRSSFDAVVAGDTLYVVGGWALNGERDDSEWHGTAWQMDLSQEKLEWKPLTPTLERRAHTLCQLNGKLYLIGGMGDDAQPTTSVMVLDLKTGKWSDGPDLPGQPMDGFGVSAFNVGGKIVASTFSGQVLLLSDDGSRWLNMAQLKTGRFFHRLVAIDDERFVILGGTSAGSERQTAVLVMKRTPPNPKP